MVSAFARAGDRLIAATSGGLFEGILEGGWTLAFGIPARPLALLVPPDYATERMLLLGGGQSGIILLNDTAPDLTVRLLAPQSARGGESMGYIVEISDHGLLPVAPGVATLTLLHPDLTLDPPNQSLNIAYGALQTGQVMTTTITVRVGPNVRPSRALARLEAALVPGERFGANNSATALTLLRYGLRADQALVLGGQTMVTGNQPGTLRARVLNLGEREAAGGGTLTLNIPPGVTLVNITPRPTGSTAGTLTWTIAAQPVSQVLEFSLSYQLPVSATLDTPLPIDAALRPGGDDREPDNNSASVLLRRAPDNPQVIVLTNWLRLGRFGPIDQARAELDLYLRRERGVELPLDSDTVCTSAAPTTLACRYAEWDRAIAALAGQASQNPPGNQVQQRVQVALRARNNLVLAIYTRINQYVNNFAVPPKALYIIGEDVIIPHGTAADQIPENQGLLLELAHATTLSFNDPLYSVLAANYYVTDQGYRLIGGRQFWVGRQPGTPSEIAAGLQRYNQNNGQLDLDHGTVAGAAYELTENTQREICSVLAARQLINGNCADLSPHPSASLPVLGVGGSMGSLSEHSDQRAIGDLKSSTLVSITLPLANLLLLLGCHTGLDAVPDLRYDPSLVATLSGQGQPVFGYSAYAYADRYDGQIANDSVYAEQLQLLLIQRLLEDGLSLGEAHAKALRDYEATVIDKSDPLVRKTLSTLILYGPPTYRVDVPAPTAQTGNMLLATLQRDGGSASPASASLTLHPSYISRISDDGTRYEAQLSEMLPAQLVALGHTIQPGATAQLPAGSHGALIRGGTYHDTPSLDPVIPRIAPLGSGAGYTEPEYRGPRRDWAIPAQVQRDGSSSPRLMVTLGQWIRHNQTQRLFDALILEITSSSHPTDYTPPRLRQVNSCRRNATTVLITLRATDVVGAEIVIYDAGQIRTLPMRSAGKNWSIEMPIRPGVQFLIQAVDAAGNVAFDTHSGKLYGMPSKQNICAR